jgi:two-component system, response regulator YesN
MKSFLFYFIDIFVPIASGIVFFTLAKFVRHLGPLRQFSAGRETYDRAFWGFVSFGLYLISRPLQILLGPHPMPLIINNIREFFMIGLFGPSIFIALYGLAYGGEKITRKLVTILYTIGISLAALFCVVNIFAIGGSSEIFRIGNYPAYDGLWFKAMTPLRAKLMALLFAIRLTDPVILFVVVATIALRRASTYPEDRKKIYSNMPKKLLLSALGTYCFSLSMLTVGFVWLLGKTPNQWWGYYAGALVAGLLEAWSIALPMRKEDE